MDHSTLECRTFTSGELSTAEWPESGWDKLAAWHSGSVLLYNGNPLKKKEMAEQEANDRKEAKLKKRAQKEKEKTEQNAKDKKRAQKYVSSKHLFRSCKKLPLDGGPEQPRHGKTLEATQVEQIRWWTSQMLCVSGLLFLASFVAPTPS